MASSNFETENKRPISTVRDSTPDFGLSFGTAPHHMLARPVSPNSALDSRHSHSTIDRRVSYVWEAHVSSDAKTVDNGHSWPLSESIAPSQSLSDTHASIHTAIEQQEEQIGTPPEEPYSVLTKSQKIKIMALVSLAAAFSPLSSNIYFPALGVIAKDLNTNLRVINLSVTVYMVMQGLAPSVWGPLADIIGRRQILIYTLTLYCLANLGLALTNNLTALMVLRAVQAAGSSSTISIGAGIISDIFPPSTRGGYMGKFAGCRMFAQAIGPVLGGILTQTMGYHSIFWFLFITGTAVTILLIIFLPETLHSIAGNGSIPLRGPFYKPLSHSFSCLSSRKSPSSRSSTTTTILPSKERITPLIFIRPLLFLTHPDVFLTLLFGALVYTVFSMVLASTTSLLETYHHLSTLGAGLSFIPNGLGCVIASLTIGKIMDTDFDVASRLYRFSKDMSFHDPPLERKHLPIDFPIERARLNQVGWLVSSLGIAVFAYGFSITQGDLLLPLVVQFVIGFASTAIFNLNSTLIVDLYPGKSAGATAVNNLARCSIGAAGTAVVEILIERFGPEMVFMMLSALVALSVPLVVVELKRGSTWRSARQAAKSARK